MSPFTFARTGRLFLSRLFPLVLSLSLLAGQGRFSAGVAQAITITFAPAADAYVDAARPSANFGAYAILRTYASPEQRSYLRFVVTGLGGQTITRATLRLYANGSSAAGYAVRQVGDNAWSETAINYTNMPALGAVINSSGEHGGARYTDVDVTSYITGDGTFSLALTTTSTKAISYPSREAGTNAPQLVIEATGGPTVTATATPSPQHTPTSTSTSTATPTLGPSPTATFTATASPTPTRTATPAGFHPADTNYDGAVDNAELLAFAGQQLALTVAEIGSPSAYPRANQGGRWVTVTPDDWTSGFFPGALWYLYAHTGDPQWQTWAASWTAGLESQKTRTDTHDIGFTMTNSFVRGYELTANSSYRDVALQAANSLASRYDPEVRAIRSWSFGSWAYPVIIDNMMNLELLFWAARNGGGTHLYDIAVSHALTAQRDHVRPDGTTFHLVDYNASTGAIIAKSTHQGYNRDSTWARGQAWGIYGFTLAYRETGRVEFLNTARRLADYYLANVPSDSHVPYWDFEAPDIPDADRDASGAAITASALYELASFAALSATERQSYRAAADAILDGLRSPRYLVDPAHSHALLLHSFGVHPDARQGAAAPGLELDVPLIYADMYLIEALLRQAGRLPTMPPPATSTPGASPTNTSVPPSPTLSFTPVADAYVDAARPTTSLGASSILRTLAPPASPEQRSYLRFSVSGLAGRAVARAVLRLYANGSSAAGYQVMRVASNTWSETSLTYNNKPALGSLIASHGSHGGGVYTQVDITPYITGEGLYSLALTTTSTKVISYPSREASTNRPQLVLTLGP